MSEQQLATFSVSGESESHTRLSVETRGFEFVVDEPENLGGDDEGPNPLEYQLGALAGCLNVVGHAVAREMDLGIESFEVDLEGDVDPAKFMGKNMEPRAGFQEIRVDLDVQTDADAAALEEWIERVEERCPVSDNLGNETPIDFSIQ
jgi:uncharacterized OsmC-like protein